MEGASSPGHQGSASGPEIIYRRSVMEGASSPGQASVPGSAMSSAASTGTEHRDNAPQEPESTKSSPPTEKSSGVAGQQLGSTSGSQPCDSGTVQTLAGNLATLSTSTGRNVLHNFVERSLVIDTNEPSGKVVGTYGTIYKSRGNKKKDLMSMKIRCKVVSSSKLDENMWRSLNVPEFQAARLMHFAIVPLFGMFKDDETTYFLFPFLERGDLWTALLNDLDTGQLCLKMGQRLRILYHIASAIDFLHNTKVVGFKGTYVHGNITTRNIVLDEGFNARLTNFDLAQEPADNGSVDLAQGLADNGSCTVQKDCFNFGVVISEVLVTVEMSPEWKSLRSLEGKQRLDALGSKVSHKIEEIKEKCQDGKEHSHEDIFGKLRKIADWPPAGKVQEAAIRCLDGKMTPTDFLTEIKEGNPKIQNPKWSKVKNERKCDVCMLHIAMDVRYLGKHAGCKDFNVCLACMRNSYLNPIKCHTCDLEFQPFIGGGWAAILIAGHDDSEEFAKLYVDDVNLMHDTISSPNVMGIRKELIKCVRPSKPGQEEDLKKKVQDAFEFVQSQKSVNTLLLFFSGHYTKESGFRLGSKKNCMKKEEMEREFENCEHIKKHITFLDCCDAPVFQTNRLNKERDLLQMNACNRIGEKKATVEEGIGSAFTHFLAQALFTVAFTGQCFLSRINSSKECEVCPNFKSKPSDHLVNFLTLYEYVDKHTDIYHHNRHFATAQYTHPKHSSALKIAYHMDTPPEIELNFISELRKNDISSTGKDHHKEPTEAIRKTEAASSLVENSPSTSTVQGQVELRGSSSSGSFSESDRSSMPSENWEANIERYPEMPAGIKTGNIDVLILYAKEDRDGAEQFRQHLIKDIKLKEHGPVKALLYDCEEFQSLSGSKIDHLEESLKHSTFIFIYLTEAFVNDKRLKCMIDVLVMMAVEGDSCVVSVHMEKPSFEIPFALRFINHIKYYDRWYITRVKKLIDENVSKRVEKDKDLKIQQMKWIENWQQVKRLQQMEEMRDGPGQMVPGQQMRDGPGQMVPSQQMRDRPGQIPNQKETSTSTES